MHVLACVCLLAGPLHGLGSPQVALRWCSAQHTAPLVGVVVSLRLEANRKKRPAKRII